MLLEYSDTQQVNTHPHHSIIKMHLNVPFFHMISNIYSINEKLQATHVFCSKSVSNVMRPMILNI